MLRDTDKFVSASLRQHRIGNLPVPLWLLLAGGVVLLAHLHAVTTEITVMAGVLVLGGSVCAWLGGLLPLTRKLGGSAICAAFLPSYLVYRHWLPADVVASITSFTRSTNFIYLYIAAIVVGSILSMDRRTLLGGLVRIAPVLLLGSLSAFCLAALASLACGVRPSASLVMIAVPLMGGGVGEGAIPLSTAYAKIYASDQGDLLGRILPVVLLANFVSIVFAGLLNLAGRRWPSLTGNGQLQRGPRDDAESFATIGQPAMSAELIFSAVVFALSLYILGQLVSRYTPLPAPIVMLFAAVALRCFAPLSHSFCHAAGLVSRFAAVSLTYPLLFAVAVALTPWASVRSAFHPATLLIILASVFGLVATGFLVARWVGLHPVEAALVNACHTGAGGTGDVAILTAAERLELMPFAQVATRIGGAVTVTAGLLLLRYLGKGH